MNYDDIPTSGQLRDQIKLAEDTIPESMKVAIDNTMAAFIAHIAEITANPSKFTSRDAWVVEMPSGAYHGTGYDRFMAEISKILCPKGYRIEQSHDGGGMYSTLVVRWDKVTPRPFSSKKRT